MMGFSRRSPLVAICIVFAGLSPLGAVQAEASQARVTNTDANSDSARSSSMRGRRICDRKPPGRTKTLYTYSQGAPPAQMYLVAGWRTAFRNCSKHRIRVRVDIAFGEDTRCKTFFPHEKRRWRYERKWPDGLQPDKFPRSIVSC